MNRKPTYHELKDKAARLEKELLQRRRVEKGQRKDFAENAEGILQVMFNATHDNALLLDPDGTVLAINTTGAKGLGKSSEDIVGKKIYDLLPEKVVTLRKDKALQVISHKKPVTFSEKAGGIILDWKIYPVFDENDRVAKLAVFGQDITERKSLEKQLQEARKMDALGTLAGGIAHQFNNALTAITGNIGLLEMDLPEDHHFAKNIEAMKTSSHRMVHLTRQLLAYARGGRYHLKTVPMGDFLENTLSLVEHTLKPSVRLETDLPSNLMEVKADRTQMQMVISGIVANANEAIEEDGHIRISARNIELDASSCRGYMQPGPYVRVDIADDGKGMDEETQNRIFEPFFTTHFIGRGLGMAAVYGIVTNHGGSIHVESRPGKGTRVSISLPAAEAVETIAERAPENEAVGGEGTVLLIEDESDVMEITREALKRLGYGVIEAATGKEAVRKIHTGPIDVALLDIKLPDMNGAQVYPLIMKARPGLKVVVFSGYALEGPAREIMDAGADGFLQKPFSIQGLSEKIKEVLEK